MITAAAFAVCLAGAAEAYDIPRDVLSAIREVEGARNGDAWINANGSEDLGVFQINSYWLPQLAALQEIDEISLREALITDPCYSANIAAWILHQNLEETGGDLWQAVARYHSPTEKHQKKYLRKVLQVLEQRETQNVQK